MTWKPHATVAAIIQRDNKFLMVEELIKGERLLNQPAGHLEPDETLIQAAIRETREESAWRFTPEAITGVYLWTQPDSGKTFLRVAFCGQCDDYQPDQTLDDGILRAVWMSHEEIVERKQSLRSPMVIDCIDDYLAGKRYPLDLLIDVP